MKKMALFGVFMMTLGAGVAQAGDHDGCDGPHCVPKTKDVCFNLVCYYKKRDEHSGYEKSCKAASTFIKAVTLDGGEVLDDSKDPRPDYDPRRGDDDDKGNNPTLEVKCDDDPMPLFNNSGHRYTDLLGTRIQGETGPHPAITLPRGELHSGPDGRSGDHISPSALEFDTEDGSKRLEGTCYIWTGTP